MEYDVRSALVGALKALEEFLKEATAWLRRRV